MKGIAIAERRQPDLGISGTETKERTHAEEIKGKEGYPYWYFGSMLVAYVQSFLAG